MRRASKCERDFIRRCVCNNMRLDGRQRCEYRHISVDYGVNGGNVIVSFGETRVQAFITTSLVRPRHAGSHEGRLNVKLIFSPIATCPHYVGMRNFERIRELKRHLEHTLRLAIIDLELLCVIPKKFVWQIDMSFTVLNDDGNVAGCASFAALACLMTKELQRVRYNEENDQAELIATEEATPEAIRLKRHPFTIQIAVFANVGIMDPCYLEDCFKDGTLTVSISPFCELNTTNVSSGLRFDRSRLIEHLKEAATSAKALYDILMASIDFYNQNRGTQSSWLLFAPGESPAWSDRTRLGERQIEVLDVDEGGFTDGVLSSAWIDKTMDMCDNIDLDNSEMKGIDQKESNDETMEELDPV